MTEISVSGTSTITKLSSFTASGSQNDYQAISFHVGR